MLEDLLREAIRKECRKTTQQEVAARAGISQTHINGLLNGRRSVNKMSIDTLEKLFPDIKISLHGESSGAVMSSIDHKILSFVQELDEDTKLDVFRTLIENYSSKKPVRKTKAG